MFQLRKDRHGIEILLPIKNIGRHRSLEFSGGLSPVYMVISRISPGYFPENSDEA
jgi:hypothetical protein